MRVSRAIAVSVFVLLGTPSGVNAQDLFLSNAKVVDPANETIVEGNLLIVNGVIAGYPDRKPDAFTGDSVDIGGKWVIPGLNDLHTHSYGNTAPGRAMDFVGPAGVAKRMLFAGVTGFLDLFAQEDQILSLRDQQRSQGMVGADMFAAGPCFTASEGHCTEYGIPTRTIDTPEQAREQIAELSEKQPDVIKIVYDNHVPDHRAGMPTVDKATLQAAVAAAAEHNIPTVVHIGTWDDAWDAVEAGATAVTHAPFGSVAPAELVQLMRERRAYSIPTLVVLTDMVSFIRDPSLLDRPLLNAVTIPAIVEAYRDTASLDQAMRGLVSRIGSVRAAQLESVKRFADSGVSILTGTDAGNFGVIQGYSVHRELQLLVEAGLTPWHALRAATVTAGEFLGRQFGVTEGSEGNLVVLEGSPIDDIRNTESIAFVIHHGTVIDRETLLGVR